MMLIFTPAPAAPGVAGVTKKKKKRSREQKNCSLLIRFLFGSFPLSAFFFPTWIS